MDFFTKLAVSLIIVLLLAEITKRMNPVMGGLISGLPLGAGLSVYFVSSSLGLDFMLRGIPWAIAGLSSSLLFCLSYFLAGKLSKFENKYLIILGSSLAGFGAFLLSALLIKGLNLNLWSAGVVFSIIYLLNILTLRKFPDLINRPGSSGKANTIPALLVRGAIVGLIISAVTGMAYLVGSRWTGILSSFPSTLYALLLILHYEEGDSMYPGVIYGFSFSVVTLVVFYLSCLLLLPTFGLNLGYVLVYMITFVFLYFFNKLLIIFNFK